MVNKNKHESCRNLSVLLHHLAMLLKPIFLWHLFLFFWGRRSQCFFCHVDISNQMWMDFMCQTCLLTFPLVCDCSVQVAGVRVTGLRAHSGASGLHRLSSGAAQLCVRSLLPDQVRTTTLRDTKHEEGFLVKDKELLLLHYILSFKNL